MKILVALDGSEPAFNALASACKMALKLRYYVAAMYVNKGVEYTPEETGWQSLQERIESELENLGREVLRRARAIGKDFGLQIEEIQVDGLPAAQIARYVDLHGVVKLIAMGHSSKGRGAQEFVESTTRAVITALKKPPVFITSEARDIDSLLIAVDDAAVAQSTVAVVGPLAKALGATIRLLAVVPDAEALLNEYRQIAEVPNLDKHAHEMEAGFRKKAGLAVERAQSQLITQDLAAEALILQGNPATVIAAEARKVSLAVIGIQRKPEQKRTGKILDALLDCQDVNLLCVQ